MRSSRCWRQRMRGAHNNCYGGCLCSTSCFKSSLELMQSPEGVNQDCHHSRYLGSDESFSSSRRKPIQAGSKLSFLDNGLPGSTTRQNGGKSSSGTPLSLCSSHAYSATIRKNREVDTGHVASQACAWAIFFRNCCRDTVSPGRIFLSSAAISCGLEICSFEPLFTPAKSFSRTT